MKWIIFTGFLVLLGHGEGYASNVAATPDEKTEQKLVAEPSPLIRRVRGLGEDGPAKVCQPGQEFRLDCNTCLCDNEGQSFSCTRIDCTGQAISRSKREAPSELVEVETNCTPGSVFQSDCNACRCAADGRRASCSREQCTPNSLDQNPRTTEADPGFRCNPGEQFKKNCNDCTCSADGRSTFCTLRFCDDALPQGILP